MQTQTQIAAKPIFFRKPRVQETCHCNAYTFPHRAGSGKCSNPGTEPGSCSDCSFGSLESDPYGTGDRWYTEIQCSCGDGCPWQK